MHCGPRNVDCVGKQPILSKQKKGSPIIKLRPLIALPQLAMPENWYRIRKL
jgi:hypothetical protein